MKILLVGSSSKYAIEKPYLNYLQQHTDVTTASLFAAQNRFLTYYKKSILHKILYRAGLSKILTSINEELKHEIVLASPDVVFVFKGMEIFPETLQWIKRKNIKLVNYNPDNPFVFTGKGSGNRNITESVGFYDLHFTYDQNIKSQLEQQFKLPVQILPFGFDLSDALYKTCSEQKEVNKVCFLGNPDADRARFIQLLAEAELPVDVYGHEWKKVSDHPNVTIHDAVYGDEFWMVLSRYRVQLNLMRVHNPNSHNMRSFEIPGSGGVQLAPNTPDHFTFFEPEKEIFIYRDMHDCVVQVKKILSFSTEATKKIRHDARDRSVRSGYTYRDRASEVVSGIKTLF